MCSRPGKPGARGAVSSREPRAPGEAVEVGSTVVSTPPRTTAELAPHRTRSTGNIRSIWSKKPHPAMRRARSTSGTKSGICAHATLGELQRCGLQPRDGSMKTPCYPTPCCTRNIPLPCMEPMGQFDMWRDYLGLADMVAALFRDHEDLEDPSVLPGPLAPCAKTASCARTPPCAKTAPRAKTAPCARIAPRAWPAPCARPALHGGGLPPCSFCQHNGEAPKMYRSHSLRDAQGRLQCPVLRNYVCPQCGATQDRAHTRRYCPRTHRGYTSVYTRPARPRSAGRKQWNTRM